MASTATITGPRLAALLGGDLGVQARRLLAGGRVERLAWYRTALAGDLVAPNGRRFSAELVIDRDRRLTTARCACQPRLRPGTLCPHLVALVLHADDGASAEPVLPGERFEGSVWLRAAEALFDSAGTARWGRDGGGIRGLTATGTLAAEVEVGDPAGPGWPGSGLLAVLGSGASGEPGLSAVEKRLRELTRSPEEILFSARGGATRRQALEASPWWLLAKRAFELGDGRSPAARTALELDGPRLRLVAATADVAIRLALPPRAVDQLHRDDPARLPALGLPIGEGRVRQALRLAFAADGGLDLTPVYVLERPGAPVAVHARGEVEAARHGSLFVLADERIALPVEPARRPFAEPETGAQASFDLGAGYRPSPIGQSLEQPTAVPASEVARFLVRHSAEIRELPAELLPSELRAGGPPEPDGAELVLHGLAEHRYELGLAYRIGGRRFPFAAILAARQARQPLLVRDAVLVDPAHPRFAWRGMLAAAPAAGSEEAGRLRLTALEVCRLRSYLPVDHQLLDAGATADGGTALRALDELTPDAPPPPPETLGLPLFDFQRSGYAWLWFLWRHGFGGILADDMGLGKTYQAIALMAAIRAVEAQAPRILVVCPASVLPHWEEKLRTLVPGLPVRRHHGSDRRPVADDGVLLTTYGTLRNDAADLAAASFDLFVLDEMQTIKNRGSATHQALRELNARVAIGLSGTPVENHVTELHTLIDFVLPGYLPEAASFERTFARPIADGDPLAKGRLARLVRPFVLRRTKAQVLTGLPPKIDDRRLCAMTPEQAVLYQRLLAERGDPLRQELASGAPVPYLHVFALLSKLKQLCNHPDLLLHPGAPPGAIGSGKWDLFCEILDEALGSGLKVVVFSQYLRMLDRIAAHLDRAAIGHATLRGSTTDRATPVARFRDEPACRVFLASLKAAGVGIDLTAASVVIHYDRWWNRAREDQATDRVHRLGQQRGVQVVTLLTEGTVEERIDQLITDKGRLAGEVVPEEELGALRRFRRDELARLLAP